MSGTARASYPLDVSLRLRPIPFQRKGTMSADTASDNALSPSGENTRCVQANLVTSTVAV